MSVDKSGTYKCPCCNNPWASGEFFAKLCQDCDEDTKEEEGRGLSRSNMDFSVKPSDNFYLYANGIWMKENPIPAGYPSWNTFLSLHVKSQENLKDLLQKLLEEKENSKEKEVSEDERKVSTFYACAMDEETIESAGKSPLSPVLEFIEEIVTAYTNKDLALYAKLLGELSARYGIHPFISSIQASPDNANSSHSICQVSQGGLGLPDRDYYFDEDKQDKRDAYLKHVANMLVLLDVEEDTAKEAAKDIYEKIELPLAEKHTTKTDNRDPELTYNKMTINELTETVGEGLFDFGEFFIGATSGGDILEEKKELGDINVRHTAALKCMATVATTVDASILRQYLRWSTVHSFASYLSKAFVDEDFDFYQRTLTGTQEIKPRWKRAMVFTEAALGEALGQLYCAKYFDEECKERAVTIVENVRQALEERLKEVEWMTSEKTRKNALEKMKKFKVKIGYPDEWIDYTSLDIQKSDTFLSMIFKARVFEHAREVKEMNAETNRDKWFLTPQTVNAYYHPSLNEIVFPAAILQPPFFNREADDAVNYGAMGAVVGHEMTHGFDDQGRKFNYEGNMLDWWTEEDATEYEKRVKVMIEQANNFKVHDQAVQGKLTCGENIADSGGILLAYRALTNSGLLDDEASNKIDGFTRSQRFFVSWAQAWRQNITKERALQLLTLDPHGPNEMRCNLPLSNIEAFHKAFDIPEDSNMYKPLDNRVDIW